MEVTVFLVCGDEHPDSTDLRVDFKIEFKDVNIVIREKAGVSKVAFLFVRPIMSEIISF